MGIKKADPKARSLLKVARNTSNDRHVEDVLHEVVPR